MSDDSSDDRDPIEELAEEFLSRRRRGETPALQEYVDRHPELEREIREVFPALLMMEEVDPASQDLNQSTGPGGAPEGAARLEQLGDFRILREVGRGGMGIVYEAEQLSLGRRVALKVLSQQMLLDARHKRRFEREAKAAARLHHTNIVPVFGVGAHDGMYYYVMQFIQGLGLDQVIDELKRQRDRTPAGATALAPGELKVSRRQDEPAAQAARSLMTGLFSRATIDEPDGLGEESAGPACAVTEPAVATAASASGSSSTAPAARLSDTFSVGASSAVLPGHSDASDATRERRKQTYWHSVAQIGRQVAEALQYAHAQGVLHRDIKPSNLLLDLRGTVWVTDFGLAKAADEHDLTQTGDILGTLRYIPPEAFSGVPDARGDVYSLGLTLYELVALQPAFQDKDRHRLIKLVTTGEPERVETFNREVPRDLATIVHKAIDHDADRRYQTAAELANDLARFLDDEPIRARPPSLLERVVRWARRNRQLATALSFIGLLLVVGAVAAFMAAANFRKVALEMSGLAADRETERRKAIAARDDALGARASERDLREQERDLRHDAEAARILADERAETIRRNLYFAEMGTARRAWNEMNGAHRAGLLLNRWRENDNHGDSGDLRGWEWYCLASRMSRPFVSYRGAGGAVLDSAWSPDGRRIATATSRLGAELRDAATGRLLVSLRADQGAVHCLAWGPGGAILATGAHDGLVQLWEAQSGRKLADLTGHQGTVSMLDFSPDRKHLLSAGLDGTIRIWDVVAHHEMAVLRGHARGVGAARWAPGGGRIASASEDGTVRLWDAQTGAEIMRAENPVWRPRICYSPDGLLLACTASSDLSCRLLNAESLTEIRRLRGHAGEVCALAFDRDGARLASGGIDGLVQVWDVETGKAVRGFRGEAAAISSVSWNPDGSRLLSGGEDSALVRHVDRDQEFKVLHAGKEYLKCLAWSADGRKIAAGGNDATLRLWDVATARETAAVPSGGGTIIGASWHPREPLVAFGCYDGTVGIWDDAAHEVSMRLAGESGWVSTVDWSPDGERLAAGSASGLIRIWRPFDKPLDPLLLHGHQGEASCLRFSPDGKRLASGSQDATIKIWDAETGEATATFTGHRSSVDGVSWSPDGARLASGSWDRTLKIWDVASSRETATLKGHSALVYSVAWSPDGSRLASSGMDRQVKVWDVATGQEAISFETHGNQVIEVAWSPDGLQLASASFDATIHVFDATAAFEREGSAALVALLDRRLSADPDRARDYCLRARAFARLSDLEGARRDRQTATQTYERLVASRPDDDSLAGEYADFLLHEALARVPWTTVEAVELKSTGGATLTSRPDHSIQVSGENPPRDQYALTINALAGAITGLRLEALPDAAFPNNGPGRDVLGNFVLTRLAVSPAASPGAEPAPELAVRGVWTDFTQHRFRAGRVVDRPLQSEFGWAIYPLLGQPHSAIFEFDQPLEPGPAGRLNVELGFGYQQDPGSGLGHFRIALTSAPHPARLLRLRDLFAHSGARGWARLAAVGAATRNSATARAALERSATAPGEAAADEPFLLAAAAADLGQPELAERQLERGLARLAESSLDVTLSDFARDTISLVTHRGDSAADDLLPPSQHWPQ